MKDGHSVLPSIPRLLAEFRSALSAFKKESFSKAERLNLISKSLSYRELPIYVFRVLLVSYHVVYQLDAPLKQSLNICITPPLHGLLQIIPVLIQSSVPMDAPPRWLEYGNILATL